MADGIALRIGLISDTHGLLRQEALAFLRGCDRIIHGGDIGGAGVLRQLADVAPVIAVRGNNDHDSWADPIAETELLVLEQVTVYALHDALQLDIDLKAANIDVVIAGHSHKPRIEMRDGVVFINPGSAGPRRFKLPIAAGELLIGPRGFSARIIDLLDARVLAEIQRH